MNRIRVACINWGYPELPPRPRVGCRPDRLPPPHRVLHDMAGRDGPRRRPRTAVEAAMTEHGTHAGYQRHRRAGEDACEPLAVTLTRTPPTLRQENVA